VEWDIKIMFQLREIRLCAIIMSCIFYIKYHFYSVHVSRTELGQDTDHHGLTQVIARGLFCALLTFIYFLT